MIHNNQLLAIAANHWICFLNWIAQTHFFLRVFSFQHTDQVFVSARKLHESHADGRQWNEDERIDTDPVGGAKLGHSGGTR
ncbi:hypothetical protein OUZ56_027635 [Daphnia magna]|uniref:Secreted protein n=1 Tax=Daphnia magna TaxID=35525 RepID=A0ABR0B1H3_9CRUS|nr:hypothetical protein OUZ56_027635 [Daphnia magna]